jgi:hypothetical protein
VTPLPLLFGMLMGHCGAALWTTGRLRIMHAKPVEALGLRTAVVYDMIPADYYQPSNFGWDAHGLFADEEGIWRRWGAHGGF